MRLQEILKRMAEIKTELTKDGADIDALDKEFRTLLAEKEQIEKRNKLIDDVNSYGNPVPGFIPDNEERNMNEKRAKLFAETGAMSISGKETRSILLSTGTLAKPSEVGGINDPQNILSSIVDLVTVEDLTGTGSYSEAYQKSYQTADTKTDGTAQEGSDPVFRTAAINPFMLATTSYVSKNLKKQTPLKYEEKVRNGAMIALKKKVVNWIIKGNGSTQAFGIYNAVNTETVPESMTQEFLVDAATIDATTLRKIVFAFGGDENIGTGAKLFLNKNDLIAFGDVRGTNEKKAVYEIIPDGSNPNIGIIKDGGLSVPYVICSDITALTKSVKGASKIPTMIYGVPGAYKLGLFGDYEVNVSTDYKFAEGLLTVMGEAMVGGNVVVDKGFVVVTLDDNVA